MAVEYKLTYWDMNGGLAEPIRHLFALAKVPFEDIRIPYTVGQPSYIPPEIKQKLPYGQVPILEFSGELVSQSSAIGRYLARKFGFWGKDELQALKLDELSEGIKDFSACWGPVWYATGDEKASRLKTAKEESSPKFLKIFNQTVEKNGGKFLLGESVSFADLVLVDFLNTIELFFKLNLLQDYPSLQGLVQRVGDLPEIREWDSKH